MKYDRQVWIGVNAKMNKLIFFFLVNMSKVRQLEEKKVFGHVTKLCEKISTLNFSP